MRIAFRVALLLALSLSAAVAARAAESDPGKLQGTWLIQSAEEDGKPTERLKDAKLTFLADYVVAVSKFSNNERYEVNPIALDEATTPHRLTIKEPRDAKERTAATAIYKIEQDVLTLCFAEAGKGEPTYPADFTSGEQKKLATLKRVPAEPLKGDAKLLQGTWAVESAEHDGKKQDDTKGMEFSFGGGFMIKRMPAEAGQASVEAKKFQLDEAAAPHRLTVSPLKKEGEQKTVAIYEVNNDTLKICAREGDNAEYPADFQADDANLVVLKRKK